MRLFAIGVEHAFAVAVQRLQYADARQHEPGAAGLCGPDQVLNRDLPYLEILFCLWQFGDVSRGVPERDELPAVGEDDRIFELAGPFRSANGASPSC